MKKCKDAKVPFVVASLARPQLNGIDRKIEPVGNQSKSMANIQLFNDTADDLDGPKILFYDYNGQTESINVLKVHHSYFVTLPVRDMYTYSNAVSVTDFTQCLGRGNRYGGIPAGVSNMAVKIFPGEWEHKRCCALFSRLHSFQDSFAMTTNVTAKVPRVMGDMFDFTTVKTMCES